MGSIRDINKALKDDDNIKKKVWERFGNQCQRLYYCTKDIEVKDYKDISDCNIVMPGVSEYHLTGNIENLTSKESKLFVKHFQIPHSMLNKISERSIITEMVM